MVAIALDFYTIPVAVPSLSSRSLGYTNSAWLGTAFLASFALGLLIWPRFCRGFGYKFSFVVAIDTFNLGTCFAATSKTPERLIALRLVAGAGAGGACGLFDVSPTCPVPCVSLESGTESDFPPDDLEGNSPNEGGSKVPACFLGYLGSDCGRQSVDGRSLG